MNPHLSLVTDLDSQRKSLLQQERELIKAQVHNLFSHYPNIKSLHFLSWEGAPPHNFSITEINNFSLNNPHLGHIWGAQNLFAHTSGDEFKSFLIETKMKVKDFQDCFEALFLIRETIGEANSHLLTKIIKEILPESKMFIQNGTREVGFDFKGEYLND